MVLCNLAVLLAERNLTITKVSKDTGISRTTLTALSRNYGQGIQFDTLNGLCAYLKITPSDLLSFFPFDMKITHCRIDEKAQDIEYEIEFKYNNREYKYNLCGDFYLYYGERNIVKNIEVSLIIAEYSDEDFERKEMEVFTDAINQAPLRFLNHLSNNLIDSIITELDFLDYKLDDDFSIDFNWGDFKNKNH